jgi:ubiquinone/menaquinone biosynthesis C-methylase UbiE
MIMDNETERPIEADDMRLGKLEFWAMNNPLRRWIQKHTELKIFKNQLKRCLIDLDGKVVLDAGCGSGYSTELIVKEFNPSHIVAFDYMPEQINLARKRNLKVDFSVGNLTKIDSPDNTFDAVFVFGVLHHIPEWRKALSELSRVLKPDGVLLVDEPRARFNWKDFESGIKYAGMDILDLKKFFLAYFCAYLCKKT